jgi:hypothetical protein
MKRPTSAGPRTSLPEEESWKPVIGLLADLRATRRHPNARATIDRMEWAIGTLARNGGAVTASAVSRLCADRWGGPRAQSIANDQSGYAELIRLARAAQTLPTKSAAHSSRRSDLLSRISDPMVQAEVRILVAEAAGLRGQVAALKHAIRRLDALGPITAEMAIERVDALEDLSSRIESRRQPLGLHFTSEEHAAVRAFLASLHDEGFTIAARTNDLLSRTGRRVAKGELITALRKIAEHEGAERSQLVARE